MNNNEYNNNLLNNFYNKKNMNTYNITNNGQNMNNNFNLLNYEKINYNYFLLLLLNFLFTETFIKAFLSLRNEKIFS